MDIVILLIIKGNKILEGIFLFKLKYFLWFLDLDGLYLNNQNWLLRYTIPHYLQNTYSGLLILQKNMPKKSRQIIVSLWPRLLCRCIMSCVSKLENKAIETGIILSIVGMQENFYIFWKKVLISLGCISQFKIVEKFWELIILETCIHFTKITVFTCTL